jgi:antitoxin FitA
VRWGRVDSVKIAVDLSPSQADRLRDRAKSLGVAPEDLARAAVADLLANPDDAFRAVAEAVLEKNAELYRRLA